MISPYDAGFLFAFKARRRAHGWDYATEAATLKTGKKTTKHGDIIYFQVSSNTARSQSDLGPISHGKAEFGACTIECAL